MASDTWWYVALILLILGIILLAAAAIWYASIRKSEWYIWLLFGLGILFILIAIFIWIYYSYDAKPACPSTACNPCGNPVYYAAGGAPAVSQGTAPVYQPGTAQPAYQGGQVLYSQPPPVYQQPQVVYSQTQPSVLSTQGGAGTTTTTAVVRQQQL